VPEPVISVSGLRKSYGGFEAVKGIDLEVSPGEIFAFLGPNGAGKTTTVEVLEGYRQRSGGEVSVLGVDPSSPNRGWRERIGIVLQECRLTPELTVTEAVEQYAGYYSKAREVDETVRLVGLGDKAHTRTSQLSGGQQRRLDVALALVGDPELLFLDEPTTGFDPAARRQAWKVIASLRDLGKTVFLTTHYMEEAQALADRVGILAAGEVVAQGAPDELAGADDSTKIEFRMPSGTSPDELPLSVREMAKIAVAAQPRAPQPLVSFQTTDAVVVLRELTVWATDRGSDLPGLEVTRPSLEDVYLHLTAGHEGPDAAEGEPS
jgi:ABC-2 type transport system ATP-binding protein